MISSVARLARDRQQVGDDRIRRGRVEVLAGLVEDEQGEVGEQGPGDRQALALAARHPRAALADLRAQPRRQSLRPVEQPHSGEGRAQLIGARLAPGQPEVLLERAVEDMGVLRDQPDHRPALIAVEIGDLHAVERHGAASIGEEPQQHTRERRLAGAACAHDGHAPARAQVEVDSGERPAVRARVAGAQAAHAQRMRRRRERVRECAARPRAAACPSPRARARPSGARAGASGSPRAGPRPARTRPAGSARARRAARRSGALRAPPRRRPAGRPTSQAREHRLVRPWPTPAVRAARPGDARELRSPRRGRVASCSCGGAVDGELGGALDEVDDAARSAPRAPPPAGPRCERRACRSATARASPRAGAPTSRIRPAAGSIHHTRPTVAAPTPRAIAKGGTHPQQQVLQRVDVVDQAREQIAAAERRAGRAEPAARGARRR